MIPLDYITEWRARAPWVQDFQVEQDLVISRAMVEIFSHPLLAEGLAFRGGTALYKLHLKPARYSEDIDLVQLRAEASGSIMDALRKVLDPWLGKPYWKQTKDGFTFVYRFDSEDTPPMRLRLKVEINSREHFSVFGFNRLPFSVDSRWFRGTSISSPTSWTNFSPPSCGLSINARRAGTSLTSRLRWGIQRSIPTALPRHSSST